MSVIPSATPSKKIEYWKEATEARKREEHRLELCETFGVNPNFYLFIEDLYFHWLDKIWSHLDTTFFEFIHEYKETDPEDATKLVVFVTPSRRPLDLVNYTYIDTVKYFRQFTNEQVRPLHLTGNGTTHDNLSPSEREWHEGVLSQVRDWQEANNRLPRLRIPTTR